MKVLLALGGEKPDVWRREIISQALSVDVRILGQDEDLQDISCAIVEPDEVVIDKVLTYSNIEHIISIWAGVDGYMRYKDKLSGLNIIRAVGHGLQQGMAEYVIAMSLNISLKIYEYREDQERQVWAPILNELSGDHTVGVLGLGKMGGYVCEKLRDVGFNVRGFSRSKKTIEGVECYYGEGGLELTVKNADIVVCLLPLYEGTRGILGSEIFSLMKTGASIINVGRGEHVNQKQLLEALESGQINRAILDVFAKEPLAQGHEFWNCGRITVTPHIAARSRVRDTVAEILRILRVIHENQDKDIKDKFGKDIVFDMERGY